MSKDVAQTEKKNSIYKLDITNYSSNSPAKLSGASPLPLQKQRGSMLTQQFASVTKQQSFPTLPDISHGVKTPEVNPHSMSPCIDQSSQFHSPQHKQQASDPQLDVSAFQAQYFTRTPKGDLVIYDSRAKLMTFSPNSKQPSELMMFSDLDFQEAKKQLNSKLWQPLLGCNEIPIKNP